VEKWFWPPKCTAQTRIDYLVFEEDHMYTPDHDPEGLLSTLTTSAVTVCAGPPSPNIQPPTITDFVGTLISTYLVPLHHKYCISETSTPRTRIKFYSLLTLTSLLLILPTTHLLTLLFPLSKPLWTPPFLVQTVGITLLSWVLASTIDMYPSLRGTQWVETMGRKSLEIYLAAEILQEFVMWPGKRRGGGVWEGVVRGLEWVGWGRRWSCLVVSLGWAGVFAGFGILLDFMGWRIKL
jgi:predicted acyltransferase